jgi:DNA-binding SARP family transcriptional activator
MASLELLGSFRLLIEPGTDRRLPKKAKALLAFLAVQRGQPMPRDRLCALLWPDRDPELGRHNLRQSLVAIRSALASDADRIVQAGHESVMLDGSERLTVDVNEFERLRLSAHAKDLALASELYRDEFLSGLLVASEPFDEWLLIQRSRLSSLACDVFRSLAQAHERSGDFDSAVAAAKRLTDMDPLREDGHRLLMEFLASSGRRSEALRQYAACAEILRRELGIAPDEETTRLAVKLRSRPPVTATTNGGGNTVVSWDPVALSDSVLPSHAADPTVSTIQNAREMTVVPDTHRRKGKTHAARTLAWGMAFLVFLGFATFIVWSYWETLSHPSDNAEVAAKLGQVSEQLPLNSRENYLAARQLQQSAVEADPRSVHALTGLALTLLSGVVNLWSSDANADLGRVGDLLDQAERIAPGLPRVGGARCQYLRTMGQYDAAVRLCTDLSEQNPRWAFPLKEIGYAHLWSGQFEDAIAAFLLAEQIDPAASFRWAWLQGIGLSHLMQGREHEAVKWLRLAATSAPNACCTEAHLASAYALVGRDREAREALASHLKAWPISSTESFRMSAAAGSPRYREGMERLIEGLRRAGLQ